MSTQHKFNLELEKIRNLQPILAQKTEEYTKCLLQDITLKVKDIHTAYLFFGQGLRILQIICTFLSSTTPSFHNLGWEGLADKLGLSSQKIKVIMNNAFYNQTPTFNTIFAYSQNSDATLDKLIQAIHEIGRWDILNELKNEIDQIKFNKTFELSKIIRKNQISNIPLELLNLKEPKISTNCNKSYDKIVMLTFTSECIQMANEIAKIFRQDINGRNIGVFIVHEHPQLLNEDYEKVLRTFFFKSSYVIPILSHDYLKIINSEDPVMTSADSLDTRLDTRYCNYIYSLMTTRFDKKKCRNDKVRCIVFDEQILKYTRDNPLFRVWFWGTDIEELPQRILNGQL